MLRNPADLLAATTEFAAYSIVRSITDNVKTLSEISTIMASGGGTRNVYLMERLAAYMPKGLRLTMSEEFGIPAAFKEAIKFATLAHATINGLANNIPAASGTTRFGILGKLVQPLRLAKLQGVSSRRRGRLCGRRGHKGWQSQGNLPNVLFAFQGCSL